MRTLQIQISEADFQRYNLGDKTALKFSELVEKINLEYAKRALMECNEIAQQTGLAKMTMDEINAEIRAVRDAKNNS